MIMIVWKQIQLAHGAAYVHFPSRFNLLNFILTFLVRSKVLFETRSTFFIIQTRNGYQVSSSS